VESLWGFNDVYFFNNSIGWVAGHRNIWHTEDGGNTWLPQLENENPTFNSIYFDNPDTGWCLGYNPNTNPGSPYIYKTNDGGLNWDFDHWFMPYCEIKGLFFVDENMGWIVGDQGTIWQTVDGGITWQSQTGIYSPGDLSELFFIDQNHGWAVGHYFSWAWNGILMQTNDGGETWISHDWTELGGPQDIFFTDPDHGWVSGDGYESSFIKHTLDGGSTWVDQFSRDDHSINDIFFSDQLNGWAVGYDPTGNGFNILRTANGGNTWNPQDAGTESGLNGVFFLDETEGWAVGWSGTIIHTIDAGSNWEMQNCGLNENLENVYFIDNLTGWVASFHSLLQTDDGGLNWNIILQDSTIFINSIKFLDELTWWYVDGSSAYHTNDGGVSWQEINTGVYDREFFTLFFTDLDHGWIAGSKGTIMHIKNGSTVEISEPKGEENNTLLYPNPSNGFVTIASELLKDGEARIFVYDLNGQVVHRNIIRNIDDKNHYNLDCSEYPPGVYLITIWSNNNTQTYKLIKE
jgi:photosystem II stability/assembly factor-like uncharacterized protein